LLEELTVRFVVLAELTVSSCASTVHGEKQQIIAAQATNSRFEKLLRR
ncbi:35684_t:CDS:1, partial [Racocetra persica]